MVLVPPIAKIHGSRNQGVETGIITTRDPIAKLLLPVTVTSCYPGKEDLVPEGEIYHKAHQ